jgi:anti-anti-sigma factor
MKIGKSEFAGMAVLSLRGRMDAASEQDFEDEAKRLVAGNGAIIAVDLSELSYISSAGIGALMRLAGNARARQGDVVLCGAKGIVKSVLEITGVGQIFRLYASVPEAAAARPALAGE